MTAPKTLAEKMAAERANAYRVALVRKQFAAEYTATIDKDGNYVAKRAVGVVAVKKEEKS